jgi:hypothetical protein
MTGTSKAILHAAEKESEVLRERDCRRIASCGAQDDGEYNVIVGRG